MIPEEISDALSCAESVDLTLGVGGGIQATFVGKKGGGYQCKDTAVVAVDLAWGVSRDILHYPTLLPQSDSVCSVALRDLATS